MAGNQSQMSVQGEHSSIIQYLKCLIEVIHKDQDIIDLKLGRPIKLEDFNCLSSENMLKILAFLLGNIAGKKPTSKFIKLPEFGVISGEDCYYDCGPDLIYHMVKGLFPVESDLFHYSMLLFPAKEPRRTKLVLFYIMSFVIMADNVVKKFEAAYAEVQNEMKEKAELCTEMVNLQEQINDTIVLADRTKERLPILQREVAEMEKNIGLEQIRFSGLNKKLEKAKTVYEAKEKQIIIMELKLGMMETEANNVASQIVSDPVELKAENERMKAQHAAYTERRATVGNELEKCRKECAIYEALIPQVKKTIENFDNIIKLMTKVSGKKESDNKSKDETHILARKLRELKTESEQLAQRHSDKLKISESVKKTYDSKREEAEKEIVQLKWQIEDVQQQRIVVTEEIRQIRESIYAMDQELAILKVEMAKIMQMVVISIPQQREDEDARMREQLDSVVREFSSLPAEFIPSED